jgi:hypothetical protein
MLSDAGSIPAASTMLHEHGWPTHVIERRRMMQWWADHLRKVHDQD